MRNRLLPLLAISILIGCTQGEHNDMPQNKKEAGTLRLHSNAVNDSFSVFVALPADYDPKRKYPVVYLLDANIYFNIMAATVKTYNEIGGFEPVILVGIGYKDLALMDSLRSRDFTYPVGLAEYEMGVSGGANNFLSFIKSELIPYIDKNYSTETGRRTLIGHSLGGYFTLYALYQHLTGTDNSFSNYIAGSPSLNYNNEYLLHQFATLKPYTNTDTVNTYITFGGLEDEEDKDDTTSIKTSEMLKSIKVSLAALHATGLTYKTDTFSNLSHMDTPFPSFTKGLMLVLNDKDD